MKKTKKPCNPHELCCTPASAWSYSFFSWNRLTNDWAKCGAGLLPEHCLPASYIIALWNNAKNTRAQHVERKQVNESSELFFTKWKAKCLMRRKQRVTLPPRSCIIIPSLNTHPFLFPQDKCVIKVKLSLLFMTTEKHNLLCSPVKTDIWFNGGNST